MQIGKGNIKPHNYQQLYVDSLFSPLLSGHLWWRMTSGGFLPAQEPQSRPSSSFRRTARWLWSRWAQSRKQLSPSSSFTTTILERTTTFECPSQSPPSECLLFLPPSLLPSECYLFVKVAFSGNGHYIFMTVIHCRMLLPSPAFLIVPYH